MATFHVILAQQEASDLTVQIEADDPEAMLATVLVNYPDTSIVSWREEASKEDPPAEADEAAEDSPSPATPRRRRKG